MSAQTTNKKPIFYIILVLLPFILLALVEGVLRLSNYGKEVPLFVENQYFPGYLMPNHDVILRYFPNPELAPRVHPETVIFDKEKTSDTFRIFVQGGSTAAGFPYGRWASIQGMLSQRFKRLYPNRKIEIINTAMSSVNSFTLLDFVDEIIENKPDLVLIYAGHNEYLGVMGVGSAYAAKGGRAATLLYLKLKDLRLYQLIEQTYYAIKGQPKQEPNEPNRTIMSAIAKEQNIKLNSELYQAGIDQFSGNLSLILSAYQNAGIPVMISNLVSNEKDQVPFSAIADRDWDAYQASLTAETAQAQLEELNQQAQQNDTASSYYQLALNQLATGDKEAARQSFIKARDRDLLRFRAPTDFNSVIREQAEKHNATFVDVDKYFVHHSPEGIIGENHMLEHLHPNVLGYFTLAEAFSDAIISAKLLGKPQAQFSVKQAWDEVPLTELDIAYGQHLILKLTSDYPFTTEPQPFELPSAETEMGQLLQRRIAGGDWFAFQNELLNKAQLKNQNKEAAKIAAIMSDALINSADAAITAGGLYTQIKDVDMALYYYKRAYHLDNSNLQVVLNLSHMYFLNKAYKKSLNLLNKAKKLAPTDERIDKFIKIVKQAKNKPA